MIVQICTQYTVEQYNAVIPVEDEQDQELIKDNFVILYDEKGDVITFSTGIYTSDYINYMNWSNRAVRIHIPRKFRVVLFARDPDNAANVSEEVQGPVDTPLDEKFYKKVNGIKVLLKPDTPQTADTPTSTVLSPQPVIPQPASIHSTEQSPSPSPVPIIPRSFPTASPVSSPSILEPDTNPVLVAPSSNPGPSPVVVSDRSTHGNEPMPASTTTSSQNELIAQTPSPVPASSADPLDALRAQLAPGETLESLFAASRSGSISTLVDMHNQYWRGMHQGSRP